MNTTTSTTDTIQSQSRKHVQRYLEGDATELINLEERQTWIKDLGVLVQNEVLVIRDMKRSLERNTLDEYSFV